MRDKLTSHPTLSNDGTMYFHAGNPAYTELEIYFSQPVTGVYQDAVKFPGTINGDGLQMTPFIAPDGSYLLFARTPGILASHRDDQGRWSGAQPLSPEVNTRGKGPGGEYLFFAAADEPRAGTPETWSVYWVSIELAFQRGSHLNGGNRMRSY